MKRIVRAAATVMGAALCSGVIVLGSNGIAVGTDLGEQLQPEQAAVSLAGTDASAVGADAASKADDITLSASGNIFTSDGAQTATEIPKDPESPLVIETTSGDLRLTPENVKATATDGEAVNDGEAVVYANTSKDADTAVKPTDDGLETFTNIRSADAPEQYSWNVDLPGDERLEQTHAGEVVVVDPTPPVADKPLPAPADADSLQGRNLSTLNGLDAEPAVTSEMPADKAVAETGVDKPATNDVRPLDAESLAAGAPAATQAALDAPAPQADDVNLDAERAQQTAKVDQAAKEMAASELESAEAAGTRTAKEANAANAEQAATQPVVVATIKAPESVDADGKPVDTSLEVSGDTVTMVVDHKSQDVAYPIAADPVIMAPVLRYRLSYDPVYRQETYVSSWAEGAFYIGNWHPIYCQWGVACTPVGGGWYRNASGGTNYLSYWPSWNWGPTYQLYYYPLYATRMVLDHWQPYWEPYVNLELVWADPADAQGWQTGADAVQEPAADDPPGGPEFTLISGGIHPSGGDRRRGCTYVTAHGTLDTPALPDTAHPQYKVKFCWNKNTKRVSYAATSKEFDPRVARGYEICCGAEIRILDFYVDYYSWSGGERGIARMVQDFDLTGSPTGGLKFGKFTIGRYYFAVRGYWNGDWESALRGR